MCNTAALSFGALQVSAERMGGSRRQRAGRGCRLEMLSRLTSMCTLRCRYVLRARAAVERCEQRAERRASANARRASALLEAEVGGSDLGLGLGFHGGMAPGGDGALASAFEAEDAGGGAGDWDDDCGGEGACTIMG